MDDLTPEEMNAPSGLSFGDYMKIVAEVSRAMRGMPFDRTLNDLREAGWSVAVHNDYAIGGSRMTFWLLTHAASGLFVKGEGPTDMDALMQCDQQAREVRTMEDAPNIDIKPGGGQS